MEEEILQQLTTAKDKKNLLAVYRDDLAFSTDYVGFPVAIGKELCIFARENDFQLDGYAALRLEDITLTEAVDDNGFMKKLLTGEKLYEKATAPRLTGADSWKALLDGVQASFGGWLTVESETEEEPAFAMGLISRLDSNFLYLRQVEPDGSFHQETTTVPLQDILTVTFGGRYVETYRKYCK